MAEEIFEIKDAVRHATNQVIAVSGPMFSGKSLGAIFIGAGLVDTGKKIGVIDTEQGKFSNWYGEDPDVRAAVPQGFRVIELKPPFHPSRFIAANQALQNEGCGLIITDTGSHAWDGPGGAQDMKEKDKGWKNAKLFTRRWSSALQFSSCHQIVCLRAQEKTKIVGQGRDQEYIPLGIAPIAEKNFYFDISLAFMVEGVVDNRPATHLARPVKWPKAMNSLFNRWEPQLLTIEVGKRIKEWNNEGAKESPADRLRKKAAMKALEGVAAYQAFFDGLKPNVQEVLVSTDHANNLITAKESEESDESDAAVSNFAGLNEDK